MLRRKPALTGLALRAPYGACHRFSAPFVEENLRLSEVRPQAVSFELGGEGQSLDGGQLQGGRERGLPLTDRWEIAWDRSFTFPFPANAMFSSPGK